MKGRKRERESGVWAGKFSKVELGNRCEGRGAALKGRVAVVSCMLCMQGRARASERTLMCARERVHPLNLCVQARAGKGQDMSAH